MNSTIQSYFSARHWKYETNVIIATASYTDPVPYENILQSLSAAGILNIAFLFRNQSGYFFVYHNPYLGAEFATTYLRNPKNWAEAFPNKLKDLNGHQMKLVAIPKPPNVIQNGHAILGMQPCLWEIIIRRFNATYRYELVDFLSPDYNGTVMTDLFINYYYFSPTIIQSFEVISANTQDVIRVMIRFRKAHVSFAYVSKFLTNKFLVTVSVSFFAYMILFYILFFRKSSVFCMTGWRVVLVMFRQPALSRIKTRRERIYIAAGVWFAFFAVATYECQFTSNVVVYQPQPKIKRISELTKENMRIFADRFLFSLLNKYRYNMSEAFINNLQLVDGVPWDQVYNGFEYAHVISMASNDYFFKSAANLDPFGYERFYLLKKAITSIPIVYPFLSHSPYKKEVGVTLNRIFEAGLRQYCQTRALRKDLWDLWSNFQEFDKIELQRRTQVNQFSFAVFLLLVGWLLSLTCLLVEISIVNRRQICDYLKSIFKRIIKRLTWRPKKLKQRRATRKV